MSKDPAFLFYPNDYIGGTMGMTFEEKGAYIELLMLQFNRGHMTSLMAGQVVGQLWLKIQDKFKKDSEGLYYNERLDIEIEKRKSYVHSRFNNLSGNNQYSKKPGHKDGHMTSLMENENDNTLSSSLVKIEVQEKEKILNVPFESFWDLYNKKEDRIKCEKRWLSMTDQERGDCIIAIPAYIASTPDKKFRKNPYTYLYNKSWNNEIIISNGTDKWNNHKGATPEQLAVLMANKLGVSIMP